MPKLVAFSLIISSFYFFFVPISYAHPGRTASDGCHYCRTNCVKWGEVEGARHCHSGSTTPTTTKTYVAPATTPEPTTTPQPTPTPSPSPTPSPTPTPTATPQPAATPQNSPEVIGVSDETDQIDNETSSDSAEAVGGLALVGGAGYAGYRWLKGRKVNNDD